MATLNEHISVLAASLSDYSACGDTNFIYIHHHHHHQFIAQKFRENSNKNVNKCNWN